MPNSVNKMVLLLLLEGAVRVRMEMTATEADGSVSRPSHFCFLKASSCLDYCCVCGVK